MTASVLPPAPTPSLNKSYKLHSPTLVMVMQPFWNETQLTGILKYVLKSTPPARHRRQLPGDSFLYTQLLLDSFTVDMSCGSIHCSNDKQEWFQVRIRESLKPAGASGGSQAGWFKNHNHSFIYQATRTSRVGGPDGETEWWKKKDRKGVGVGVGVGHRWGQW